MLCWHIGHLIQKQDNMKHYKLVKYDELLLLFIFLHLYFEIIFNEFN